MSAVPLAHPGLVWRLGLRSRTGSAVLLMMASVMGACAPPPTPSKMPEVSPAEPPTVEAEPAQPSPDEPTPAPAAAQPAPVTEAPEVPELPQAHAISEAALADYRSGLEAFRRAELRPALAFFAQASAEDPSAVEPLHALGVVQVRLREAEAEDSLRKASVLRPDYEPAVVDLALLLAGRGDLAEAERLLLQFQARVPKAARVVTARAELKSRAKDPSAQRLAQEALKLDPTCRPAMVLIARDHFRNRRLDLAMFALAAILDGQGPENPPRDKDNGEAHLLRGLILQERGARADALVSFENACAARADLVEPALQLGALLLESGTPDLAVPHLQRALLLDPTRQDAHLALGDAYRLLGRYAEALVELEGVAAKEPSLAAVHYDLALLNLFAPGIPGRTPREQIDAALRALDRYKELRDKLARDGVDDLVSRAKQRDAVVKEQEAASTPAEAPMTTPSPPAETPGPSADEAPASSLPAGAASESADSESSSP